jgi:hypothetical protein
MEEIDKIMQEAIAAQEAGQEGKEGAAGEEGEIPPKEPIEVMKDSANNDKLQSQYAAAAEAQEGQEKEGNKEGSGGKEGDKKEGIKKKFSIKLGRLASIVAGAEKMTYKKLQAPYHEEWFNETKEDVEEIIEARLVLVSEYGDILTLAIDLGSHAIDAGLEARAENKKEEEKQKEEQSQERPAGWF